MASIYGEYSKYTRLRIDYSLSQSIENNQTTISMNLYAERTKGSSQYSSSGNSYWNLTGMGNTVINYNWGANSLELYLGSSSIVVTHNADGTGSVALSGYWNTNRTGSSYIPTEISVSGAITLPTIPRASSISCSTADIGSNAIIKIGSASSSFAHNVYGVFENKEFSVASNRAGGTFEWSIPTSFYEQIPDDPSGQGTMYCQTYNGNTLIGTTSTQFTAIANKNVCQPVVEGEVKDVNPTTIELTGDDSKLIRHRSTAQVNVTPIAQNSATIKTTTVNGLIVSNNVVWFTNVDKASFEIITTDSREYSGTDILTPTMIPYLPLTLKTSVFRPQPTTGEVSLTYSGNYFNGSFGKVDNDLEITWKYKTQRDTEWIGGGTIIPTITENTISEETISLGKIFDYQTDYDFQIVAADKLSTVTVNSKVFAGVPVFNWGKDFFNVNVELLWFGKNLLSTIFPIGSTYITQEDINPSTILGFGTWERSKGRVLVGLDENESYFNEIGKTGGETTHTLTIEEMTEHDHVVGIEYTVATGGDTPRLVSNPDYGDKRTAKTGGSQPFNITQPYEVVGYMWIRRA